MGVAAFLLAACAIQPGEVEVKDRPTNVLGANAASKPNLARTSRIDEAERLVDRFLDASADEAAATREAALRSYLLPDETWTPGSVVNIVHVIETLESVVDTDGKKVRLRVQHVGLLNFTLGTIEPSHKGIETIEFTAVRDPDDGYRLRAPRAEVLLSDTGFISYYEARPIYFWDTGNTRLVPDLRYVPKYWSETDKASRLVDLLYGGPVSWLDAGVSKLPQATKPADRVTITDDRSVVVNLNTRPTPQDEQYIARQLLKTVVPQPYSGLQLKVQGQVVKTVARDDASRTSPNRYAVVKGVVYRLKSASGATNFAPVPLPEAVNSHVAAVAFAHGEGAAIMVHDTGEGPRLSVVRGAQVTPVNLPDLADPHAISQPFWIGDTQSGIVLADENLFQVFSDGRAVKIAHVDNLTDMSVSPEGRRIALVVDGQAYLAGLLNTDKGLLLGQYQASVPSLLSVVHSVAFGSPLELMLAGRDVQGERVITMYLDGARENLGGPPLAGNIFHLVADGVSANALYEATGLGSSQYQFGGPEPLSDKIIFPVGTTPPSVLNTDVHAPSFEGLEG